MEWLTQLNRKLLLKPGESPQDSDTRTRLGMVEGWVSIFINVLLAVIKGVLGVSLQSAGLIADAVHSLSDMASSLVVILGFRISQKPADAEHPFGHARMEYISTLIISILLIVTALELGKSAGFALLDSVVTPAAEPPQPVTWVVLIVLGGTVVVKELLALFSYNIGHMIDSQTLIADGWHHRSDALTTLVVIFGLWARNFGVFWLDGAAGLAVAGFLIFVGVKMAYDSISPLLGETATPEDIDQMKNIALGIPEVEGVHDLMVHKYGESRFTSLHIEISDRMGVHRMHEICAETESRILKKYAGYCVVHLDPINLEHPLFSKVADTLREVVINRVELVAFHDLKLWNEKEEEQGEVEISVDPEVDEGQYPELKSHVTKEISQKFPGLKIQFHLKVDFTATPITSEKPEGLAG